MQGGVETLVGAEQTLRFLPAIARIERVGNQDKIDARRLEREGRPLPYGVERNDLKLPL